MSMFSEILHESFAADLAVVLYQDILTKDDTIIKFNKENIYPLWESHMSDVYRNHSEEEIFIINFYKNI